jgi:hypothetical protein
MSVRKKISETGGVYSFLAKSTERSEGTMRLEM